MLKKQARFCKKLDYDLPVQLNRKNIAKKELDFRASSVSDFFTLTDIGPVLTANCKILP